MPYDREIFEPGSNPPVENPASSPPLEPLGAEAVMSSATCLKTPSIAVCKCRCERAQVGGLKRLPSRNILDNSAPLTTNDASHSEPHLAGSIPSRENSQAWEKIYPLFYLDRNFETDSTSDEDIIGQDEDISPTICVTARLGKNGQEAVFSAIIDSGCRKANIMPMSIAMQLGIPAIRPCGRIGFETLGGSILPAIGKVRVDMEVPPGGTWISRVKFYVLEDVYFKIMQNAIIGWRLSRRHQLLKKAYNGC